VLAEVVAPFVGRQIPNVRGAPADRRGRLAALLAATGIILAALQLIANFFDIITRPLGPLSAIAFLLPYLVLALFAAAIALLMYLIVRSPSVRHRQRAARALIIVLIPSIAWGAWWIYDRITPPKALVVAVADFDPGKSSRRVDFARDIHEQVKAEMRDLGADVEVQRTYEVYKDAAEARSRGAEHKAKVVIWGWYDDAGVRPRVEVLQPRATQREVFTLPSFPPVASAAAGIGPMGGEPSQRDLSRVVRTPATITDFDLFARNGPRQMTYISSSLLGIIFYLQGDAPRALTLFEKGIANATAGGTDILGLEYLYVSRGGVFYEQNRLPEAISDWEKAVSLKPDLHIARYNLALAYSEGCNPARQIEKAITEAEMAVRLKPNDAASHRLLGETYRLAGQPVKALAEAQSAASLDPNDAASYELLAMLQKASGQRELAKYNLERAIALREKQASQFSNNDRVATALALGDAYISAGDYDKALAQFKAAEKAVPDNPEAQRGLGRAYYFAGDLSATETAYHRAVNLAPDDPFNHLLLGLLYVERANYPLALQELEKSANLNSCAVDVRLVLAFTYLQQNEYPKAISACRAALNIEPDNADAYYTLGVIQYLQRQLDDAESSLSKAVLLRPGFVPARYALSSVYMAQKAYAKAVAEREIIVTMAPDIVDYQSDLAYAYDKAGRLEEAVAAYRKALSSNDDPETRTYLALVYVEKQDYDAAITEYQLSIAKNPNFALAHSGLAQAYDLKGWWEEAEAAYRQALALENNAITRSQLAHVLNQQGRTNEAIVEYRQAISLDPGNLTVRMSLAGILSQSGKLGEAIDEYRAALAVKPELGEAYAGIASAEYKRCNPGGALQSANSAVAASPNQISYRILQAAMYEAQGRADEATKAYYALQMAPTNEAHAHLAVSQWLERAGNYVEAEKELHKILETPNLSPVLISITHQQLSHLYIVQDKLLAAESEARLALSAAPGNAGAIAHLGDVVMRRGEARQAASIYEQAITTIPTYASIMGEDVANATSVGLYIGRSLALRKAGDDPGATSAFAQAKTIAGHMSTRFPSWPYAHVVSGYVFLAIGDNAKADAAFANAMQCDKSLASAQAVAERNLAKMR
jgi:tetratricopeptide (TPR) repeat protein